jgi:hypothetical protein
MEIQKCVQRQLLQLESNPMRKRPLFLDDDTEHDDPDVVMVVDLEQEDGTTRTGSSQTARVVPSSWIAAKQRRIRSIQGPSIEHQGSNTRLKGE